MQGSRVPVSMANVWVTQSQAHIVVCDEEWSLCFATFRPSALHANKRCSLRFLNVDVSFSSSREWLIRLSLCWETSLDFASSVWYLERRRICVGVSVQKPTRIF